MAYRIPVTKKEVTKAKGKVHSNTETSLRSKTGKAENKGMGILRKYTEHGHELPCKCWRTGQYYSLFVA